MAYIQISVISFFGACLDVFWGSVGVTHTPFPPHSKAHSDFSHSLLPGPVRCMF